jgi:hypothetical protein
MKKNLFKIILLSAFVVLLAAGCNQKPAQNNQPESSGQQISAFTVTQTVEGSNLNKPNYQIAASSTALTLLKTSHQVQTKEFSGVGEFVESIDGIKPDSKHFWEFFVNGVSSNIGASSYVLKNNDKIEWKLSAISSFKQ